MTAHVKQITSLPFTTNFILRQINAYIFDVAIQDDLVLQTLKGFEIISNYKEKTFQKCKVLVITRCNYKYLFCLQIFNRSMYMNNVFYSQKVEEFFNYALANVNYDLEW